MIKINKIKIETWVRRLIYKVRHQYFKLDNIVLATALVISAGFVWGSLNMMQRNYALQRALNEKSRQLILAELDTKNAELEQRYYKTDEYMELAVRDYLGLARAGESVLILPDVDEFIEGEETKAVIDTETKTNFEQWIDFLFGNNARQIDQ